MNVMIRKLKYRFRPRKVVRRRQPIYRPNAGRRFIFLLIVCMLVFLAFVADSRLSAIVIDIASAKMNGLLTVQANSAVSKTLADSGITYNDLVQTEKAEDGTITALHLNIVQTNTFISEVTKQLQSGMHAMSRTDVGVPAGALLGSQAVSGYGFHIPARLLGTELLRTELKDDFQSAGINQTRHKIWLEVSAKGTVGTFLHKQEINVVTQIPVAETVIVGNVPDSYTNISGAGGTAADIGVDLQGS